MRNGSYILHVQLKELLGVRRLLNGTEQKFIVQEWLPEDENTWEDSSVISQVFLEFNLEDKVEMVGVSVDKPPKYV